MHIFTEARHHTQITDEERIWIEGEILDLKGQINSYIQGDKEFLARLDKEVLSCHDCGLTSFDRSVLMQCIEADLQGMERCLELGYIIGW